MLDDNFISLLVIVLTTASLLALLVALSLVLLVLLCGFELDMNRATDSSSPSLSSRRVSSPLSSPSSLARLCGLQT